MYAKGTTISELQAAADFVGVGLSADNDGNRIRFTLKLQGEKYRKLSPNPGRLVWVDGKPSASDWKWRKANGVCYHGHYDFLAELFANVPDASVASSRQGKVTYTGDTFSDLADEYGNNPIAPPGNIHHVFKLRDCCECEGVKNA